MATTRLKQAPVASTRWIQEWNDHASAAVASEIADFGFSVGNEMDWLNEKMEDIFSRDTKTLTDLLKTPGKLRNKTPRTVRKEYPTPRQPLTDIFATNLPAGSPRVLLKQPQSNAPAFTIVEDLENAQSYSKPSSRSKSPQRVGQKGNTDSGYHGMTEDETDAENRSKRTTLDQPAQEEKPQEDTIRSGDDSFQSAREERQVPMVMPQLNELVEPTQQDLDLENVDIDMEDDVEEAGVVQKSQRKSSFNFSSLPAREPLLAKKSLGGMERNSILPKSIRTGSGTSVVSDHNEAVDGAKTTAQRLHERITLLGKAREPRISTLPASTQDLAYPALPPQVATPTLVDHDQDVHTNEEIVMPSSPARPTHAKHMSVPDIAAVVRASDVTTKQAPKAASLYMVDSTPSTPQKGSTIKKPSEGPLSASKFRLMSVLKSARSIFASSASASAAAKLEAHDKSPRRDAPSRDISNTSSASVTMMNMPGAMYPSLDLAASDERQHQHEQEVAAQLRAEEDLARTRELDRQKAEEEQARREEAEAQRRTQVTREESAARTIPQAAGKLKSVGRPVRPVKDAIPKPAAVNIKVGSQLQALHDPQSRPGSSMRPSSAHSNAKSTIGTANSTRVRAAEAAARKKELEDREKQRKAQLKKELERKRVAKIEEEQRAEAERKAEESRRAQEARMATQKLAEKRAADAKRQEQLRVEQQKAEQAQRLAAQKREEDAQRAKAAHELAETIARERAQQQAQLHPTGTLRQLTAKAMPVNPVKPPKRQMEDDEDIDRPAPESATTYQQNEGKRRKTDEKLDGNQRASVMAPPKRPSTMRKETLTRFPHGYSAQPPATHQPSGLFKTAVGNSQQRPAPVHPSQMAQTSTARIAFADNTGPATAMPSGHPDQPPFISKFKTPVRPAQQAQPTTAKSAARSSPMAFTHGDAIALPEIATDSEEEEDSEDEGGAGSGFRAPSWVASPALRELLAGQQLVDPESVFGPIGELKMEEVFRGGAKNADRLKKFRDRGSSAAWIANGDAVTSAEKRRDMAMRERVAREGGWRYEPGL